MPMWPSHSGIKSHSGSWHIHTAGTVFFRRRQSAQLVLPTVLWCHNEKCEVQGHDA
jgi:hypothetical protein